MQGSLMPDALNCALIKEVEPGPTWYGITIGKSTYQQFTNTLDSSSIWWDEREGNLYVENREITSERNWAFLEACFIGSIVSAINVIEGSFPLELEDFVAEYGPPDYVTWGNRYSERSLIWSEQGIFLVVGVEYEEKKTIILFSPIPVEDLQSSWLIQSLPKEGKEYKVPEDINGSHRLPSHLEVEDPWGYNDD